MSVHGSFPFGSDLYTLFYLWSSSIGSGVGFSAFLYSWFMFLLAVSGLIGISTVNPNYSGVFSLDSSGRLRRMQEKRK